MTGARFHLTDATPRGVPVSLRIRLLLGGLAQVGWFVFGFGMIFVWGFQAPEAIDCVFQFMGELETAHGRITRSEETNATVNDSPVWAYHYTFTAADESVYEGVSYDTGGPMKSGYRVTVEYRKDDPTVSRIQGKDSTMFGPWVAFVIIIPTVGFVLLLVGWSKGRRAIRLLANGLPAKGTLTEKNATNTRINDQTVYRLTFEFQTEDGTTFETVTRTHLVDRLTDEEEEDLLYDPENPFAAVMMDKLPGRLRIGPSGTIEARNPLAAVLVLIIPAATIVGHGLYILSR